MGLNGCSGIDALGLNGNHIEIQVLRKSFLFAEDYPQIILRLDGLSEGILLLNFGIQFLNMFLEQKYTENYSSIRG